MLILIENVPAKKLLTAVTGDDAHFFHVDYTLNLYRGCNHGCIYCDSRSLCYQIDRFDTVRVKENALDMLNGELSRKRKAGVVGMGAASDPYNAFERELKITRGALKLLLKNGFGVNLSTKSALIARDTELLCAISRQMPVCCSFSITTADDSLSLLLEPHASTSSVRFDAMEKLARGGVFAGTWMNPMLPFLTDDVENLRAVLKKTKEHGGQFVICFFATTMREGDREYFYQALDREPRFAGVKAKLAERYGLQYECVVPKALELYEVFVEECEKLGLLHEFRRLNHRIMEGCAQQLRMF